MRISVISLFLCTFLLLALTANCMAASEIEAWLEISEAKNALHSVYEAVLEAEKAGANIALLVGNLTEAGQLLSKATLAYSVGDFESAFQDAAQSQEKLSGLVAEANVLKESAAQQRYWDFTVNVGGSIVGAIAVVCGSLIVWFLLKRRYENVGSVN